MTPFSHKSITKFSRVIALSLWVSMMVASLYFSSQLSGPESTSRLLLEEEEKAERRENYRRFSDEHDTTPPDGLSKALTQLRIMQQVQSTALRQMTTRIESANWEWLGPITVAGHINAIVIHPTTPTTMWLSSPSGGIWKTIDGANSWQPLNDFLPSLNISSLVLNPTNPNELYASTGDRSALGAGIFHSTDGGTTWQQLASAIPSTTNPQWARVSSLTISRDGNILLAATFIPWGDQKNSGLWRSVDRGQSWTQVLSTTGVVQVLFHPNNQQFAVASSYGQAWYSMNAGSSWTIASGLPTASDAIDKWLLRAELAFAPSDPMIVYASVDQNKGEVWKSTNGGQTYTLINSGTAYQRYANLAGLWVDPTNPNILVVGGVDAWRSNDGGIHLSRITDWTNANSVHADHRVIVNHPHFDGNNNRTVYFGTDGGFYQASNVYTVIPTVGWQKRNNNLGITQFYDACAHPASGNVMGGTQDNGTLLFQRNLTQTQWSQVEGGDGYACAIDPHDSSILYGQWQWMNVWRRMGNQIYAENINGSHTYWNGSQWVTIWKPSPYRIEDAVPKAQGNVTNAYFFVPLILDPDNSNRLFTAGRSVWRTNDAKTLNTTTSGPAWSSIKSPILKRNSNDQDYWIFASAIAVAPGNSNIIWVGHNDGRLYKTTNGTAAEPAWTQVGGQVPNMPAYQEVTQILFNPTNINIVYVSWDRFGSRNLWRTDDGGQTWVDITGTGVVGLPEVPIRSIALHPNKPNWLYAGTDVGLFSSQNGGMSWCAPLDGPAIVPIEHLLWINSSLVATTFGRGVYRIMPSEQPLPCSITYLPLITR